MQASFIHSFSQRVIQRETLNTARMKGKQVGDGCEMHTSKGNLLLEMPPTLVWILWTSMHILKMSNDKTQMLGLNSTFVRYPEERWCSEQNLVWIRRLRTPVCSQRGTEISNRWTFDRISGQSQILQAQVIISISWTWINTRSSTESTWIKFLSGTDFLLDNEKISHSGETKSFT